MLLGKRCVIPWRFSTEAKTERQTGPPIADTILLLGREETIKRLDAALKAIHVEAV